MNPCWKVDIRQADGSLRSYRVKGVGSTYVIISGELEAGMNVELFLEMPDEEGLHFLGQVSHQENGTVIGIKRIDEMSRNRLIRAIGELRRLGKSVECFSE